ncbi:MAG TPA: hypothetical protein PLQ47_05445, partial [Candidatus Marinimicrobia bacterium]|nr:hypothetical protein [Candidatus Neomarinimicrobiota bacterium]
MILPFFIIIPLLTAFIITLIAGERDNWAVILSILAVVSLLILSVYCFVSLNGRTLVYEMGRWKAPI